MNMFDILTRLKAPFSPDKLSWRIGNKSNWDRVKNCPKDPSQPVKANMLVYIDARDVQDRLDEVCSDLWSNKFESINGRNVCTITINGLSRSDGAGDTDFEGEKGGLSDAFKRAAVMWGIGRYLYNAKYYNTWIIYNNGDTDYDVMDRAKEELRDIAIMLGESVQTYQYWLDKVDLADNPLELKCRVKQARVYAKREMWSQGKLETFKKHVDQKEKELKEKTDGTKE